MLEPAAHAPKELSQDSCGLCVAGFSSSSYRIAGSVQINWQPPRNGSTGPDSPRSSSTSQRPVQDLNVLVTDLGLFMTRFKIRLISSGALFDRDERSRERSRHLDGILRLELNVPLDACKGP